jgi:hypothetical protein
MLLAGCEPNPNGQGVVDSGTIVGRVIDAASLQPINVGLVSVGSTIVLNLSTASQGGFTLQNVPAGTQSLVVTVPGYAQFSQQIQVQANQVSEAGDGGIIRMNSTVTISTPTPGH